MSIWKGLFKLSGGREVTVQEAVDEFYDDEIETLQKGMDTSAAKDITSLDIRMVSWDIQQLERSDGWPGAVYLVGICKLDGNHYGAFWAKDPFNPAKGKGYAEELILTTGVVNGSDTDIKSTRPILDFQEWTVISEFFNSNNIFEVGRIIEWNLSMKQGEKLVDSVKKMEWLERVNSRLRQLGRKPLTPQEIASKVNKAPATK